MAVCHQSQRAHAEGFDWMSGISAAVEKRELISLGAAAPCESMDGTAARSPPGRLDWTRGSAARDVSLWAEDKLNYI